MTLLTIIHLFIAITLIFFVLIQDSKGGGMGMMGGGSSNSVLGATGAASFLVKVTRWLAICFAASCIFLAYRTSQKTDSIMDEYIAPGAQAGSLSIGAKDADKKEEDKSDKSGNATAPSAGKTKDAMNAADGAAPTKETPKSSGESAE